MFCYRTSLVLSGTIQLFGRTSLVNHSVNCRLVNQGCSTKQLNRTTQNQTCFIPKPKRNNLKTQLLLNSLKYSIKTTIQIKIFNRLKTTTVIVFFYNKTHCIKTGPTKFPKEIKKNIPLTSFLCGCSKNNFSLWKRPKGFKPAGSLWTGNRVSKPSANLARRCGFFIRAGVPMYDRMKLIIGHIRS